MTLNELKTQIKTYLIASIESGNFMLNDEYRPELQEKAHQLGLSHADLQRLINIVSKELNPDEILAQAQQRKAAEQVSPMPDAPTELAAPEQETPPVTDEDAEANRRYQEAMAVLEALEQKETPVELSKEEDIFNVDWLAEQPVPEDETALHEARRRAEEEEEQRRLAELRAKEEALARKKAEEEAVERHNQLIREKQQAEAIKEVPPQPSSGNKPVETKKPTFEGKKKNTEEAVPGNSLMKKILPFLIAFLVLGGGGVAAFYWYKNNYAQSTERAEKTTSSMPSLTGRKLAVNDLAGTYNGMVINRSEEEPVQIEIYDIKESVNQRFTFQFKGIQERRGQNMQGPGEVELSKGIIYMAHRLMGEATITQTDDGSIRIEGANFQLVKKP